MNRRWLSWLSLLTVLALMLSACGTPELPAAGPADGGDDAAAAPAESANTAAEPAAAADAGLPEVPRNRTLIMAGLGGEHPGAFTDVELFNSYAPGLSRSGFTQACTEGLFYYNMIGDEFIP
ncbi:MAG: hypothetical protein KDE47_06575, partial [Caldilineaceae bacterium]|nr:hypothetical protein [Caldilineaceae bacterium]